MPIFTRTDEELAAKVHQLNEQISALRRQVASLMTERDELRDRTSLEAEIEDLKRQRVDKEIELAAVQEKHDREERTIKHMVGLERKRQEFEVSQAKREAEVSVRESNLAAERGRFEDEMQFMRGHMEKEIATLQKMYSEVLERLPNVTADYSVTTMAPARARRKAAGNDG